MQSQMESLRELLHYSDGELNRIPKLTFDDTAECNLTRENGVSIKYLYPNFRYLTVGIGAEGRGMVGHVDPTDTAGQALTGG